MDFSILFTSVGSKKMVHSVCEKQILHQCAAFPKKLKTSSCKILLIITVFYLFFSLKIIIISKFLNVFYFQLFSKHQ